MGTHVLTGVLEAVTHGRLKRVLTGYSRGTLFQSEGYSRGTHGGSAGGLCFRSCRRRVAGLRATATSNQQQATKQQQANKRTNARNKTTSSKQNNNRQTNEQTHGTKQQQATKQQPHGTTPMDTIAV